MLFISLIHVFCHTDVDSSQEQKLVSLNILFILSLQMESNVCQIT